LGPATRSRTDRPSGTASAPTAVSRRARSSSGGAHTRVSAPSLRSSSASPATGSTSPRDPYVVISTRISSLPFRSDFEPVRHSAARFGPHADPGARSDSDVVFNDGRGGAQHRLFSRPPPPVTTNAPQARGRGGQGL